MNEIVKGEVVETGLAIPFGETPILAAAADVAAAVSELETIRALHAEAEEKLADVVIRQQEATINLHNAKQQLQHILRSIGNDEE